MSEPVLKVHHVTVAGSDAGLVAALHLVRHDGALLSVSIELGELLMVADELKRQVCELAGVEPLELDCSRQRGAVS